jgi:hypothetical protein
MSCCLLNPHVVCCCSFCLDVDEHLIPCCQYHAVTCLLCWVAYAWLWYGCMMLLLHVVMLLLTVCWSPCCTCLTAVLNVPRKSTKHVVAVVCSVWYDEHDAIPGWYDKPSCFSRTPIHVVCCCDKHVLPWWSLPCCLKSSKFPRRRTICFVLYIAGLLAMSTWYQCHTVVFWWTLLISWSCYAGYALLFSNLCACLENPCEIHCMLLCAVVLFNMMLNAILSSLAAVHTKHNPVQNFLMFLLDCC